MKSEFGLDEEKVKAAKILGIVALLCSVLITPDLSFDPINWVKLLVLSSGLLIVLGILGIKGLRITRNKLTVLAIALILVVIQMVISNAPIQQRFWGISGRATGVWTYLLFILAVLVAVSLSTFENRRLILRYFNLACYLSLGYMLLQWAGLDPIDWTSSSTFAFLGNINFSSALIGMFCAGFIPILFQGLANLHLIKKFIYVPITVMVSLFIVVTSGSQQGVFMFVLSLVTYLVIVLARRSLRPSLIVFFVLVVQSSFLSVLMLMSSRTFLNGLIFQETMGFRADYWRTAISIIWKNPWGIGPDTYGDFYRQYRDLQATTTTNSDRISDSAHSVLLDISVSFGLLAGLVFILSISWLWLKSVRCLIRTDNVIDKSILMIWFSFIPQLFIGISNIGISIWFCIFSGLILDKKLFAGLSQPAKIGLESQKRDAATSVKSGELVGLSLLKGGAQTSQLTPQSFLRALCGLVIGFAVACPPFLSDLRFSQAQKRGDLSALQSVTFNSLGTSSRLHEQLVYLLAQEGKADLALSFARKSVEFNPRNFYSWKVIASLKITPIGERDNAVTQLRVLDPIGQQFPVNSQD